MKEGWGQGAYPPSFTLSLSQSNLDQLSTSTLPRWRERIFTTKMRTRQATGGREFDESTTPLVEGLVAK